MTNWMIQSGTLGNIADAVRTKGGATGPMLVSDIAQNILNIPTGGGGSGIELSSVDIDMSLNSVFSGDVKNTVFCGIFHGAIVMLVRSTKTFHFVPLDGTAETTVVSPYNVGATARIVIDEAHNIIYWPSGSQKYIAALEYNNGYAISFFTSSVYPYSISGLAMRSSHYVLDGGAADATIYDLFTNQTINYSGEDTLTNSQWGLFEYDGDLYGCRKGDNQNTGVLIVLQFHIDRTASTPVLTVTKHVTNAGLFTAGAHASSNAYFYRNRYIVLLVASTSTSIDYGHRIVYDLKTQTVVAHEEKCKGVITLDPFCLYFQQYDSNNVIHHYVSYDDPAVYTETSLIHTTQEIVPA